MIAAGDDLESMHRISEPIEVPASDVAQPLPGPGTPEGRRAAALGREIIGRGEVAAVVLAGGMATRFGSRVKALAPVLSGHDLTFLDLKLADLTRFGVEVVLMTSFATHDALAQAVEGTGVRLAPQLVSLRLNPDGSMFIDDGAPSPHAPGHGDLADALELSGAFERFRRNGVRTLFVCNVDNVGATLDAVLVGLHRSLAGAVTAELVSKRAGDAGGLPVRRADGSLAIAEAFRVPEGLPARALPALQHEHALDRGCRARDSRRLHLERCPQVGRRARGDPVRAPRGRAHVVARVALRPRAARWCRISLRARQGRGGSRGGTGADRRDLP